MTATTYDIFQYTQNLKKAGEKEEIIDVHASFANIQRDYIDNSVATKSDVTLIRKDIELLKEGIVNLKWIVGIGLQLSPFQFLFLL